MGVCLGACLSSGMQIASSLLRIILSCVACLAVPYFPTLFHKRYDFREKMFLNIKVCSDFLYNFCLKHFSFYEEFSDMLS